MTFFLFVVVFPFDNPMLPFYLSNIQTGHAHTTLLPYPFFDLPTASPLRRYVDMFRLIIQIDMFPDVDLFRS